MRGSRAFTRQEALLLAGCTSSRLASLEKSDLIVPDRRFGAVFFTWEQVIGIRMVKCLRAGLNLYQAKTLLDFLFNQGLMSSDIRLRLALVNNQPLWMPNSFIELPDGMRRAFAADQVCHYNVFVTPPLAIFVQQIRFAATQHKLLDTITSRLSAKTESKTERVRAY